MEKTFNMFGKVYLNILPEQDQSSITYVDITIPIDKRDHVIKDLKHYGYLK